MKSVYSYTKDELVTYFEEMGEKKFKADQLFDWLYKKRVTDFSSMINLNKKVIANLENDMYIDNLEILKIDKGSDVAKYLFKLSDGEKIEAVVMYHDYGISLCISTEVGCNMGCAFCESGRLKKRRELHVNEMVLQILAIEKDINKRISHIVLMGIGEPFDNYDNVVKFINIINDNKGIDIGARHITVSTCGIVPKIYELAEYRFGLTLSVSLHAPNNEIRSRTMPVNNKYPVEEVIKACKDYFKTTGRRISFEYTMIDSVNDSDENAEELANLLSGMNCHVNLIPVNNVKGTNYHKSKTERQQAFINILAKKGITATVRRTLGSDINASCGQLKRNHLEVKGG